MTGRDPANISKEQILELARAAGLDPDGARAETIAARLGAALSELDLLTDSLAQVEPAPRFAAGVTPPTDPTSGHRSAGTSSGDVSAYCGRR